MTLRVTEEQVRSFRAHRGHLAGPGAASPVLAARTLIGAQAQQLPPALLALSLRTRGRPTANAIRLKMTRAPRTLVWTWGQRDTLHVYDASTTWPQVVAARSEWSPGGRGGVLPSAAMMRRARAILQSADAPISRSDVIDVAPASYLRTIEERASQAGLDARRLAASRLIWRMALDGDACLAETIGRERTYASRSDWFPKLRWPTEPYDASAAAAALARRYLAVHGPATPQDVAHFFHAKVSSARAWLESFRSELIDVECGGRAGLLLLRKDRRDLDTAPPPAADWPLRMLPLWESMLMAHADKSWTVPIEAERKLVWRKAAFVCAVILDRGRIVATWAGEKRSKRLDVTITPLSGWSSRRHGASARREAAAVAAHYGLESVTVEIES